MGPHVLVTGGAGYLGSVLVPDLLRRGYRVTVIDAFLFRQQSLLECCSDPHFRVIRGDARDEAVLRGPLAEADYVIPLAALVGAPLCHRDPVGAVTTNREAVATLVRMASDAQRFVMPCTNSGYGIGLKDAACTEELPLNPVSRYGRTKVEAEKLVLGQGGISLRLATVFGMSPRMRLDLLVNHFVYAAVTDGYLVIFEKDFKRNYVHIRDVADCFLHCIEHSSGMAGRPYNVGLDAANLSKAELATKVKEYVPRFYVHFSEVGSDPDRRNYIVSNRRLREAGFEAQRSLDEGIQELLKGYRMFGRSPFKNV